LKTVFVTVPKPIARRWRILIERSGASLAVRLLGDHLLYLGDQPLGLLVAPVDEQPARALRDVAPHEQDPETENGAQAEGDAPADVDREQALVQQQDREQRAEGGAEPEGPVDDQVDGPAHARWDQFVDRGVDGRVLPADPGPGEEAADGEPQERVRERRRDRRH
jgi:hypothetical protein